MAPGGSKRKRPERQDSRDEGSGRPSPHRPQDLDMAREGQHRGGLRGGRGGGAGARRPSKQLAQNPVNGVNAAPVTPRNGGPQTPITSQATSMLRDSPAIDGSRPATPSQTANAKSIAPAEPAVKQPPAPYWYEYITNPVLGSRRDGGKSGILEMVKEANLETISTVLQELVRSALDGRLEAGEAGSIVQEMISHHSVGELDVSLLFLNTISLLEDPDTENSNLLTMLAATEIDPEIIRQDLNVPLLQALSMVRDSFGRIRNRKTTQTLYRQANFNLLREETEGYAKLVTEYFNTATAAVGDDTVSPEKAFERITALIGSFDLDVGRVLDITLDISANLLVRAYRFFVKFYRCSSWWPESGVLDNVKWEDQGFDSFPNLDEDLLVDDEEVGMGEAHEPEALSRRTVERDIRFWQRVKEAGMEAFFELGTRKILDLEGALPMLLSEVPVEYGNRGEEINPDRRKRTIENRKYMAETGTLPPRGNPDAAQLLGFKLRFYASDARDAQDTLPDNLIFLAALLIKIGFISLRDLYPHLYPPDDRMHEWKTRMEKEKAEKEAKERPGVGSNALAMAGALTDDTVPVAATRALRSDKEKSGGSTPKPPEKKEEEPKDELPDPSNQKITLLKALLLIGALSESLYILGRFPWLVDVDTSLPPHLHRIANQMLSKVARIVRPIDGRSDLQNSKNELDSLLPRADGTLAFKRREQRKPTRWLGLDHFEKGDGLPYRHYYDYWHDNIPVCQDIEDVVLLLNTFLGYLGVKIGQDAKLFSTLLRTAKHSLSADFSESNQARWLDLMRRVLVPALSLSKHNAGLTQEVYELLKFFPTTTRYNIYAEWFYGKTSRLPDMRVAFDHNKAEVKDVLRRVSNETGKKQARALAKISFSSPGIVMINMISQLEVYSNMIPSLVECTRYFSLLAYDVLTWCLINSLSGQGRDRIQADGMLTSPWLQALSQFVASLFHRYTALSLSPVLQYLASELRAGNSTDLEVFEQILAEMAGIKSDMEFNDAQVLAMAGGKHLQAQTVMQLADKRHDRKPHAQRLIKALSEPGLIGQTLIAIAQERQNYPYHDTSKYMPLKVLGNNLDKVQSVFAQYLDVLKTNLSPSEFEEAVPNVVSLVSDFGIQPGIAFTICRFSIAHRTFEFDSIKKQEADDKKTALSQERGPINGDVEMHDSKPATNGDKPTPEPSQISSEALQEANVGEESKASLTPQPVTAEAEVQPWHPVLNPIIQQLPDVLPHLAERVSIPFFVSFWSRSLQDILVHTPSYDNEVNKLRNQLKEVGGSHADGSAAVKEREKKRKALTEIQDKLRDELKGRINSYQKLRNRISRQEKDHWFSRSTDRYDSIARHVGLLQECFLPRAILSSLDAHYCYLMLKILHDNGTPGFRTLHLLEQLFQKDLLATLMFQCTAMEAQHFGRFLSETLKLLSNWHSDKAIYEREALGGKQKLPGFAVKLDANDDPQTVLEYEMYRRMLYRWHSHLGGALETCFKSNEYMHIRNGITVLRAVVQTFPAVNFMAKKLVELVTHISKEESRKGLQVAATSLLGPLRNREKHWVIPQAFRLNDPKDSGKSASRAPSARPETPQPAIGTPKLNATAQEFKPSSNLTNGPTRKESITGTEDGEIEDEKQAPAKDGDEETKDATQTKTAVEESQDTSAEQTDSKEVQELVSKPSSSEAATDAQRPASKPATPAPIPSKPPPAEYGRSDSSRQSAGQSSMSRPPHALPSRPPNKPLQAPPGPERTSSRYGSRPDDQFGRLTRPTDLRPSSRDHSPGRSRPRTPERDPYYGTSRGPPRDDRGPPRSTGDVRQSRDDAWSGSRREHPSSYGRPPYEARDRPNGQMGPPPSQGAQPETVNHTSSAMPGTSVQQSSRQPMVSAQAAQASLGDNQHHENPARLAMINDDHRDGRERPRDAAAAHTETRRERDSREERPGATTRPSEGKGVSQELPREMQPRVDQPSDLAPRGPRRGRLSHDISHAAPQESSYGRLNGPSEEISGPRPPNGPGGRVSRTYPTPASQSNARANEPPASSPSVARPPESPAAFRGAPSRQPMDRRSSGSQADRPSSNSVPTTPATENGPPVHPSRLAQVEVQAPPLQTNLPAQSGRNAGSPTTAPPSGPRGAARPPAGIPTGPSPSSSIPPSGPASSLERQRRPDRRQLGSINATLQGASNGTSQNGQGVSFRGAAQGRPPSGLASASANSQPVQAIASSLDPPPRRHEGSAPARYAPTGRLEPQPDLFEAKKAGNTEDDGRGSTRTRGRDDEHQDRARGSRNASRERRGAGEQPQRPPPSTMDENTDRRSGARDDRRLRNEREAYDEGPPREGRGPERSSRNDDLPPRRPPPQGAPGSFSGPSSDWERPDNRRGQPHREAPERMGRSSGRPEEYRAPRGQEERRDGPRPPRDMGGAPAQHPPLAGPPGGRKRRHEDGPYDDPKRRRSAR